MTARAKAVVICVALLAAANVDAGEQRFHTLVGLQLDSGQRPDCTVGYRTYGTRNEDGSNAILFPTWFGGTTADLERLGKVGAGALADPERYYVITVDALGNGVSCSPSNGALRGGARDRSISTADMVRSQYRLLVEGLGLDRLHAVVGISMGGMQALRWLAMYPGFMEKVVVIDGSPGLTSYDLLHWTVHRDIVTSLLAAGAPDETIGGVIARVTNLTLYTPAYFLERIPPDALGEFLAPAYESGRAFRADDYVSQLDAMMRHDIPAGDIVENARRSDVDVLLVSTPGDMMVNPAPAMALAQRIGAETMIVDSVCGHLGSSCEASAVNARVAAFLAENQARREPGRNPEAGAGQP